MSFNTYDLGDLVRVSAAFTDVALGGAIDPDVVKLTIKEPDATVTTYVYGTDAELIKDSIGNYHADIDADQSGTWYYRWWSTGSGQAAAEKRFDVRVAYAVEA